MSTMMYKDYAARVEFDAEDHIFVGRLAGITDIVTFHGASVDELESEFKAAVDHYLAVSEQTGVLPQKPYSGELILHIPPEVHAHAAMAAEAQGKSLNQWAAEILANAC
jgi:predicted HicB family RNase H-like nuclease